MIWMRSERWLCAVLLLGLACAHGRDYASGPDGLRITAGPVRLGDTVDDTVDASHGDATDWRFLELDQTGKLVAQLHWDNRDAQLQLVLTDNLGRELVRGQPWGEHGAQAVFPDATPGRYFVEVQAQDNSSRTPYSLRVARMD